MEKERIEQVRKIQEFLEKFNKIILPLSREAIDLELIPISIMLSAVSIIVSAGPTEAEKFSDICQKFLDENILNKEKMGGKPTIQ